MNIGAVLLAGLLIAGCNSASESPAGSAATSPAAQAGNSGKQVNPKVVMYKPPTWECCSGWAEHLRTEGFTVEINKRENMDAIKNQFGVTEKLASCHTAIVDGYVIEGHVPAADVERLLKERPDIVGLTAPGMPMKSPGMQQAGQQPKGYDVLAFDRNGKTHVFTHY